MKKKIVIIYGESGSGKSAIKKEIVRLRPEYHEVITSTTRPKREGEQDGVDYHYYSEKKMLEKIYMGEFAEAVSFRDWVYGTEYDKIKDGKINIGVWNPEGVETLNDISTLECLNVYIKTEPRTRLIRSLNREKYPDVDEIIRRYKADVEDFAEINISNLVFENEDKTDITKTARKIIATIDLFFGQDC